MWAIKRQNSRNSKVYAKIILVTLVSVFIIFDEPVLAQRSKRKSGRSNTSSQKQQAAKSSSTSRKQSSANTRRTSTRSRVSSTPSSTTRQTRSSSTNISRRSSSRTTSQQSVRQPANTTISSRTNRVTTNQVKTSRPASGPVAQNRSSNSISTVGSTIVNSNQGKQAVKSVSTNISSGRTSRIGSVIGNSKGPASITRNQSMASVGLSTTRIRSSIGSILGRKETNISVDTERSGVGTNRSADTSRWSHIGSRIIVRKSPAETESQATGKIRSTGVEKSEAVVNSTLSRKKSATAPTRTPRGILGRLGFSKKQQNNNSEVLDQSEAVSMWSGRNRGSGGTLDRESGSTRPRRGISETQIGGRDRDRGDSGGEIRADGVRQQRSGRGRPSSPRFHDRPHLVRHENNHVYVYRDQRARLCYRMVRPTTCYIVGYNHGWDFSFGFFYPFYHRKYVFVSLGGYWPWDYSCVRYYWYGWHPYYWCGYYPIARAIQGDTYNYYTYNYYNDDNTAAAYGQESDYIPPVDHNTFADVREKLAREQAEGPDEPTLADNYFESAVKSFEAGNYDIAVEWFAGAVELAPDDMILPYAYCQALFANQQYAEAAEVLRAVLKKVDPEEEGVFYPRGLYADDEILFEQIEQLNEKADLLAFDADLQLLLGYQLLGVGQLDEAVEPLLFASQDAVNADAAVTLIELLEKIVDSETEGGSVN
jgi:hypothetical protein